MSILFILIREYFSTPIALLATKTTSNKTSPLSLILKSKELKGKEYLLNHCNASVMFPSASPIIQSHFKFLYLLLMLQ